MQSKKLSLPSTDLFFVGGAHITQRLMLPQFAVLKQKNTNQNKKQTANKPTSACRSDVDVLAEAFHHGLLRDSSAHPGTQLPPAHTSPGGGWGVPLLQAAAESIHPSIHRLPYCLFSWMNIAIFPATVIRRHHLVVPRKLTFSLSHSLWDLQKQFVLFPSRQESKLNIGKARQPCRKRHHDQLVTRILERL